jgi:cytochrome P450
MKLPPRIDLEELVVRDDPYDVYRSLRDFAPLARAGPGTWAVTRYEDVSALLRDPRLGSEFPDSYHQFSSGEGAISEFLQRIILYRDPPKHTRRRTLVGKALSERTDFHLQEQIRVLVDNLLDTASERGSFDAIRDFAAPLPFMVVCRLLGIPVHERDVILPWVMALSKAFAPMLSSEARSSVNEGIVRLREYIVTLLEERGRVPSNDVLSTMFRTESSCDRLSREEIVDNAIFLLFAGFETTTNLIGTGCALLLKYPDQLERLRQSPELITKAVEEFLRFDAPIQAVARLVHEPILIGGRLIREGRVVLLLLGSANHDESIFNLPEQLDVARFPNPHLGFSAGAHACLGAQLARIEGKIAFTRLIERFPVYEPAGKPVRRHDTTFRSYEFVPVIVRHT